LRGSISDGGPCPCGKFCRTTRSRIAQGAVMRAALYYRWLFSTTSFDSPNRLTGSTLSTSQS